MVTHQELISHISLVSAVIALLNSDSCTMYNCSVKIKMRHVHLREMHKLYCRCDLSWLGLGFICIVHSDTCTSIVLLYTVFEAPF